MDKLFLLLVFYGISSKLFAQDTLFVNRHHFESPVQNVFEAQDNIFVKTTTQLLQLQDNKWKVKTESFSKPYVFFKDKFYESDFIPNSELFDINPIKELIPQKGKFIATAARKGSRFFVASGSALFEYEIRDHYSKSYHNHSIRDIYLEDSLKVISTYSGIYVNDSIRLQNPKYSNGPLVKIGAEYFLTWDELSQFFPPDSTAIIPSATGLFAGKARKVIEWNGETYALNTKSVSKVLPNFELQPIHQGLEYLDLEAYGETLVFSTFQGLLFGWNGQTLDTLGQLPAQINDIYIADRTIYLASDAGVFQWKEKDPKNITKIASTRNSVMTQLDDFNNLWISTENGLYVLKSDYPEPIPIIPNVEFNREALLLADQVLYVGAVDGLYSLHTYEITKSFIPEAISNLNIPASRQDNRSIWIAIASVLIIFGAGYWFYRIRTASEGGSESSPKKELDLKDLEEKILSEKILTVEALAAFLGTNTVQLNRNFKKMGTTPGKFLKYSKLHLAENLLKSGKTVEEVANQVGYSPKFLRQELGN